MKKIFLGVLFFFLFSSPLFATGSVFQTGSIGDNGMVTGKSLITYPAGADFDRLKKIIEQNFSPSATGAQISEGCIFHDALCPNYHYTSLTEKSLQYLIAKTYSGNEVWYANLFSDDAVGFSPTSRLDAILAKIPSGVSIAPWTANIETSGVDSNIMIRVIDGVIVRLKREKCEKAQVSTVQDCYENVGNEFLPTEAELFAEPIFLYGKSMKIGDLSGEVVYTIIPYSGSTTIPSYPYVGEVDRIFSGSIWAEFQSHLSSTLPSIPSFSLQNAFQQVQEFRENPTLGKLKELEQKYLSDSSTLPLGVEELLRSEFQYYKDIFSARQPTYTLTLRDTTFTRAEAHEKIYDEEMRTALLYYSSVLGNNPDPLPCYNSGSLKTQCEAMEANAQGVIQALKLIERAQGRYPENIEALRKGQVNLSDYLLDNFTENFHYEKVGDAYQITYIGDLSDQTDSFWKKNDYHAIMSGSVTLPAIFSQIPRENIFFSVEDPTTFFTLLEKENTSFLEFFPYTRWFLDIPESLQNLSHEDFLLSLEKNITHPFIVTYASTDMISPDFVAIFSEEDKKGVSEVFQNQTVVFSGGYIYVASSEGILDQFFMTLARGNMASALDLQAFWSRYGDEIHTAFFFVGDGFFQNISSLDTYVSMYRRNSLFHTLWLLQEKVWAYEDAFGELPSTLQDLPSVGTEARDVTGFSLSGSLVFHPEIGTINQIFPPMYTITSVTNAELQGYLQDRQMYRILQKNINPMGIIIDRYGDGIDIHAVMFPIPEGVGWMKTLRILLVGNTKDTLEISKNEHIQTGIMSIFFGFDREKFQKMLAENPDISAYFKEFQSLLDGKNIFDFLAGEFALVFSDLPSRSLEVGDIEDTDMHFVVDFQSAEKGEKFLETLFSAVSSGSSGVIFSAPQVETYNEKKIYTYGEIPFLFSTIQPVYFFDKNSAFIGLNSENIKNTIDIINTQSNRNLVDATSFQTGTFLGVILHGESLRRATIALENTSESIFTTFFSEQVFSFRDVLQGYIIQYEKDIRSHLSETAFSYDFAFASIRGESGTVFLSLDRSKALDFSGTALTLWDTIRSKIPSDFFTSSGASLDRLDSQTFDILSDVIVTNMIDKKILQNPDFFQNMTAGISLSDTDISGKVRIFHNSAPLSQKLPGINTNPYVILLSVLFLVAISGGITFISRNSQKKKS